MMATADEYAAWIVKNKDKKGTPEFDTVAQAYQEAKAEEAQPVAEQPTEFKQTTIASDAKELAGRISDKARSSIDSALTLPRVDNVKGPRRMIDTDVAKRDIQGGKDWLGGMVRGAGSIGSTLLYPFDKVSDVVKGNRFEQNAERRQGIDEGLRALGANPDSMRYKGGKLTSEIAGTAGVSGLLAKGAQGVNASPKVVEALRTGGFRLGGAPAADMAGRVGNAALRTGAGAAVGGASAGLVDPKDAKTGALIGGAMPGAVQVAGKIGSAMSPSVTPEVADLYKKAQSLGIEIPADRMVDSRPLNAVSASLNYVPLSGRMATEDKMLSQFNRAVSRSFGQDSDNVTMALRKAGSVLGKQFDETLQKHRVVIDNQFMDDLAEVDTLITQELNPMEAKVISNQIDAILTKGQTGSIDGQAAYNIKKTLDRIGNRKTNDAYYARELKKKLMAALNRSMPADEATAFANLRQQYGNMLDVEGIAQNGAEGGVSVAKLANMKNINNPQLQDLADIAAQFLKTRESPHGAAQRVGLGLLGGGLATGGAMTGTLPLVVGGMAGGRAMNTVLNSNALKSAALNKGQLSKQMLDVLANPWLRTLPVVTSTNP